MRRITYQEFKVSVDKFLIEGVMKPTQPLGKKVFFPDGKNCSQALQQWLVINTYLDVLLVVFAIIFRNTTDVFGPSPVLMHEYLFYIPMLLGLVFVDFFTKWIIWHCLTQREQLGVPGPSCGMPGCGCLLVLLVLGISWKGYVEGHAHYCVRAYDCGLWSVAILVWSALCCGSALGCCLTSCIVIEHRRLVILLGLTMLAVTVGAGAFGLQVYLEPQSFWSGNGSFAWHIVMLLIFIVLASQFYFEICVLMIGCIAETRREREVKRAQNATKAKSARSWAIKVRPDDPAAGEWRLVNGPGGQLEWRLVTDERMPSKASSAPTAPTTIGSEGTTPVPDANMGPEAIKMNAYIESKSTVEDPAVFKNHDGVTLSA
jgi:hypothetical protein